MDQENKQLKIYAWNACGGLYAKRHELESLLINNKVDICLLSETLIKDKQNFNIKNYKTYKNNTNRGTAILVKNDLNHYVIPIDLEKLEATAIKIKTRGQEVAIISTYNSPSVKFNKADYTKIFKIAPIVIAAGDFNAKHTIWGSRSINTLGKNINQFCFKNDLSVHAPSEFTHYPFNTKLKPDIIDFMISKNLNYTTDVNTIHELDSDHYPIEIVINLSAKFTINHPRYNLAKADWTSFQNHIDNAIKGHHNDLKSIDNINIAILNLTNAISEALEIAVPKNENKTGEPPLPQPILDLIKSRNKNIRENHVRPNPLLKLEINQQRKNIDKRIKEFKCNTWNNTVKNLNIKDNSLWRMTKGLTRKQTNIPALKNENNEIKYFSPEDKANAFGMHFANTFVPHENESEEAELFITETDRMVSSYLSNLEITDPKYKATPFEIKSYL